MSKTNVGKYFFDALVRSIQQGIVPKKAKESTNWWRTEAQKVDKLNKAEFIRTGESASPGSMEIGHMYLFNYDPKHKLKLPVYDTFPLIFPFSKTEDRFWGINLHYLPPKDRARLMDALMTITNNDKYDKTTKLELSYSVLKQVAKGKKYEETIHCYINKHVKSRMKRINPLAWEYTIMLPLAKFRGKDASKYRGH